MEAHDDSTGHSSDGQGPGESGTDARFRLSAGGRRLRGVLDPMETSYFIGRETLLPRISTEMALWRERLFATMFRNGGTAADHFGLPPNRVVELGTQVAL